MNPRRFDSETMVSRAATDGPGSSTEVVGLSAVTVVSSGTGGRAIEPLNDRTFGAQFSHERACSGASPRREICQQISRHRVIMVGVTQGGAPFGRGRHKR